MKNVLLIGLILAGCEATPGPAVPPELLGAWRTSAEGYEDRGFQVVERSLRLDVGGGAYRLHPVTSISVEPAGMHTLFTVRYRNEEGVEDDMKFYYESRDGRETIRLRNMETIIWERASQSVP